MPVPNWFEKLDALCFSNNDTIHLDGERVAAKSGEKQRPDLDDLDFVSTSAMVPTARKASGKERGWGESKLELNHLVPNTQVCCVFWPIVITDSG